MQFSRKRVFEYFRNKIAPKGILFLQETHSSAETEKQWNGRFKGQLYFSQVRPTHFLFLLPLTERNINVVIKK